MNDSTTPSLPELPEIWQQTLNWQPTTKQQVQLQRLYELILEGNQKLNLTRITDPHEFWEKHLWDSLRGVALLLRVGEKDFASPPHHFIDIGTGAGFPGIPVAIALPDCTVTLVDSTRKKIAFLEHILPELALENVKTLTGRAEEIGQQSQYRQNYDVAMIRAVSNASVCAEYTLPLLKQGGLAIIYRGNWTEEETTALTDAVKVLGGEIEAIEQFTTPLSKSLRHCLYLRKIATTPAKFPRAVGIPTHKPL
ncbi:16S rRNA (guanine(527)-N(7))-methyltransferase RsmG [Fischerella thermalis]|uniref:16S rRNA (guanine(527)-N(7))-methyltransferase RsmG n=1 Tax=Fischerella thermalis TaxID=372787 RepID=UPI000C808402|nr:16S rRNA (guanine(527)-N(7))-methyltransferase RsmG [Fischerella thermalis]MBF1990383.1 16S rRNA (guanine(527)-N(7))-methyltransferase RsmG [Fischerella thermalis M58_A2018_009]MBF2059566.1 16S rRNA (guanine(527)-N(7))-methyltransferase RsmG [Fischerella thermalis M66_A2018_004]MBF2069566.1 16S rRNA (guanine(527)-N(7))-methyltransferase RsmG [Fischerella thermalis M48_A2018_028]PLZ90745.1 16S rRNA (guanine(527)-N(7))-methyltransferase RsmG [Fischerella thermalis CCMEE 5194]